jgi:hypothetical protein
MEEVVYRSAFILLLFVPLASGDAFCGGKICEGSNAYCCHLIDGDIGCCWSTQLYDLWWFWVIWVALFFLILACSLACWRRRRAQYRYTVMANSEYPGYGTVVHTSSTTSTQSGSIPPQYGQPPGAQYGPLSGQQYGPPQGQQYMPATSQQYIPPTAPAGPPGYPGSEKPPAYSR